MKIKKNLTKEAYKALFGKALTSLKESGGVIDREHSTIMSQNEAITVLAKKSGNELVLNAEQAYTIKKNANKNEPPIVNFDEEHGGTGHEEIVPFLFVEGELILDDQNRLMRIFHSILEAEQAK